MCEWLLRKKKLPLIQQLPQENGIESKRKYLNDSAERESVLSAVIVRLVFYLKNGMNQ